MSLEIDNQERSRNPCLLIHGMNEDGGDDTDRIAIDIINRELGIDAFGWNSEVASTWA